MLTDSHAHLNFSAFNNDLGEVIGRCQEQQVRVINIGTQLATSQKAIKIAQNHDGFFASVGIHPIHIGQQELDAQETAEHQSFGESNIEQSLTDLGELSRQDRVVAIGETGLDYSRLLAGDQQTIELQKQYFYRQVKLAQERLLPLVIHCRGNKDNPVSAYEEVLSMIGDKGLRGVIHCFGADLAVAKKFMELGFYIGFTGIVTFKKKAEELQEVVRQIPLDKILIETDAPYLAPEPYRGQRNEPVYVRWTAKKIAELKKVSEDEAVEATSVNATKLFGL